MHTRRFFHESETSPLLFSLVKMRQGKTWDNLY